MNLHEKDLPYCNFRTGRFTYNHVVNMIGVQNIRGNCQIYANGKVDIQDYANGKVLIQDNEYDALELISRSVIFWMCLAKSDKIREGFTSYMSSVIDDIKETCGWNGQFEEYLNGMQDNFEHMRNDNAANWFFNTHQPRKGEQ